MNRLYYAFNGLITLPRNFESNLLSGVTKRTTKHTLAICLGICLLLGLQTPLKAQATNQKETGTAVAPAREGTYQLIFNSRNEDKDIKLTANELMAIERLRKDNEVVYAAATYSDDIRVKILPRKVINSGNFTPVPLKYYKEEQSYDEYSQIRYVELH